MFGHFTTLCMKGLTFTNLRPVMTLWKGVYHREIQKIHYEFRHLPKANHSWSWTLPLSVSPRVPVAFIVGQLVLHWGNTRATVWNYGGLRQRMHAKSSLQIICHYRRSSYLGHVSDALENTKENIKHLLSK